MSDRLQDTLRAWARRNEASAADLDKLADKIRMQAASANYTHATAVPDHTFLGKLSYAAAGALAALAVVVVVSRTGMPGGGASSEPNALGLFAMVSPRDVAAEKRLFTEIERLFSDRLRWVAQSNGDIALGVESLGGASGAATAPAAARLVVASRTLGKSEWVPVWTADVLLRAEEAVEVVPGGGNGNKLALWVYPLEDGRIAVDTDLSLVTPVKISSRNHVIADQRIPSEIMSIRDGDTEYRVIQTVTMLDNGC